MPSTTGLFFALCGVGIVIVRAIELAIKKRCQKQISRPPIVSHWIPFLGSTISYGRDPVGFLSRCRKEYGDLFTFVLLGRRVTVALGTPGTHFIMNGPSAVFAAEDVYTNLTTPVFGKGVIYDCPQETFVEQKRFCKTAISAANMVSYVAMIEDETLNFLDDPLPGWSKEHDTTYLLNAFQFMSELVILTGSRTVQGTDVRSRITKEYAQVYKDLRNGFTPLHWMMPGLPLPSYRKRDRAHQQMCQLYMGILQSRREGEKHIEHHDMMASLMQERYRDGTVFGDEEISHVMIGMLMAAHSSAIVGSWAILHLANRPDVAQLIYDEQVAHFMKPDGSWANLTSANNKLPVLHSMIQETLRLHPPVHSIMRGVREDVEVPLSVAVSPCGAPYIVPKGDIVLASPAIIQNDPALWDSPEQWNPFRWTTLKYQDGEDEAHAERDESNLINTGTHSKFQPFGSGRHRCIGEQFAYMQLATIFATIVRRFKLEVPGGKMPKADNATLMPIPMSPSLVKFCKRT